MVVEWRWHGGDEGEVVVVVGAVVVVLQCRCGGLDGDVGWCSVVRGRGGGAVMWWRQGGCGACWWGGGGVS